MRVGASEAPELNNEQIDNVDAILAFVKATSTEDAKVVLDFDPKTMKKLIADAQRIEAEQEAKAKKVAEKKKTTELKAAEKPAEKSKACQERPQLGKEPVRKKLRIEAARSYLKSIGLEVKGIPIHAEPLAMTASECLPQSTEKEAVPQHPPLGEEPVLHDEDILSTEPVGQDVTLQSGWGRVGPDHPF